MPASTATETPAVQSGELYTALCALSVGRITTGKEGDRRADIVRPGEDVRLTDEEAQKLMRAHRVPVIARKGTSGLRRVTARQLFNPPRPAAAFGALPDEPVGSAVTLLGEDPDRPSAGPDPRESDPDFGAEVQPRPQRGRPRQQP
jgi:hypothetical protein